MLMAAFAVGRAQQLIYLLQILKSADRIPDLPIFLDSPMACDATAVYREHSRRPRSERRRPRPGPPGARRAAR